MECLFAISVLKLFFGVLSRMQFNQQIAATKTEVVEVSDLGAFGDLDGYGRMN